MRNKLTYTLPTQKRHLKKEWPVMTISTAISIPSSIRAQAASDDSSMRHKPNIETKKMRQAP